MSRFTLAMILVPFAWAATLFADDSSPPVPTVKSEIPQTLNLSLPSHDLGSLALPVPKPAAKASAKKSKPTKKPKKK
jgi:hypothetical protein